MAIAFEATGTSSATDASSISVDILDVKVSPSTFANAVNTIETWIERRERQYVNVLTVHSIMECQRDPALRRLVNAAGMRTTDGMPLVWISRRSGHPDTERVYGPDLMMKLVERSGGTGHRHYFHGGQPGIAETLVEHLRHRAPDFHVAGYSTPGQLAIGEIESKETIDQINGTNPDIVWVGLGTPKQDWWVANHRPLLNAPVIIAIGAAFDFHSGRVRQAPPWMQRNGFEWLYRLRQDPKRLWRRYLLDNSRFVFRIAAHHFSSRPCAL